MGVYIKGVEMPEKCGCCFAAFPDGAGHSCCLIKNYPIIDNQKGRRSDCPLVHVPAHGRLGDLGALETKAIERARRGVCVNVLDKVITVYDIETAPTIIGAEET